MKRAFAIMLGIICLATDSTGQVDTNKIIVSLDSKLGSGEISVTTVLTDQSLMYLHSLSPFREIIRQHAQQGQISIIPNDEPGERITITANVTDKSGKPLSNALVYFYHTSEKGWYADTGVHILAYEGDYRHARLFGYIKTDSEGKFSIKTIKPKGYPQSDLAAHIHIQLWDDKGNPLHAAGELQFGDDPGMTAERKRRSVSEGFLISSNRGSTNHPEYHYYIVASNE